MNHKEITAMLDWAFQKGKEAERLERDKLMAYDDGMTAERRRIEKLQVGYRLVPDNEEK